MEDADDVEYRGDVRAVHAITKLGRDAGRHHQIGGRPRGQRLCNRHAVPVVEDQRVLVLRQAGRLQLRNRSEEHTSALQSLMRISYAVFCLKKKRKTKEYTDIID